MVDRLRVSGDPVITEDDATGEVTGDYDAINTERLFTSRMVQALIHKDDEDFVAIGRDSEIDRSASFATVAQSAVDSLDNGEGGTIGFAITGTVETSGQVTMTGSADVDLEGPGMDSLTFDHRGDSHLFAGEFLTYRQISGFTIDLSNNTNSGVRGFYLDSWSHCHIHNIRIVSPTGDGIAWNNGSYLNLIENVAVNSADGWGFHLQTVDSNTPNGNVMLKCRSVNNSGGQLWIEDGYSTTILGGVYGDYQGNSSPIIKVDGHATTMTGHYVEGDGSQTAHEVTTDNVRILPGVIGGIATRLDRGTHDVHFWYRDYHAGPVDFDGHHGIKGQDLPTFRIEDDFVAQQLNSDRWATSGQGTVSVTASSRYGIATLSSGSTSGNEAILSSGQNFGYLDAPRGKIRQALGSTTNTVAEVGFYNGAGEYNLFRFDPSSSANWIAVSADGGVETTTDTGIAADTSQHEFHVWWANATEAYFWLDETQVAHHESNVPATPRAEIRARVETTTTVNKTVDVDYIWAEGER